ncbi:MAG: EAL domain-containing protein [Negativicutes bacterium]
MEDARPRRHSKYMFTLWIPVACILFSFFLGACGPQTPGIGELLTADERRWLSENENELTVVTSNWPPYEYFDEQGKYSGYVADYIELLQKKLHVRFRIVHTKTWAEAEALAQTHKVAMITSIKYSAERAAYMNFAGPFRVVPISIITRDTIMDTLALEKMDGKKVAFVAGYFTGEAIRNSYPSIIVQPVENELTGVRLLSLGGIDAFVSDVGVVVYHAQRSGINNLRVAGETNYQYVLNIGARKDWPILRDILQKGMNDISPEENDQLYQKWVRLGTQSIWETREFWLVVVGITLLALTAIGLMLLWNRTLSSRVNRRTRELQLELEERQRLNQALALSEEKYRSIFDHSITGIYQITAQGAIVSVNPAMAFMLGYDSPEDMKNGIADNVSQLYVDPEQRQHHFKMISRQKAVDHFEAEFTCKNRSVIWVEISSCVVYDDKGDFLYIEGTCVDITARKRAEQELLKMAFHDTLTGLPNRAHLNARLDNELSKARRGEGVGAVLYIDMDDLKMVNDNLGHTCGDSVIMLAGEYIIQAFSSEAFVARMGGDEFIVILAGERRRDRVALQANRLVNLLQREYALCDQSFHMSASVGVTLYPDDADSVEEILKSADSAMYAAKAAGRNCWRFYEPFMRDEAYEKMVMTNSLRHALERGELHLHYQPQLDLVKGEVIGFEALLRWNSLEHGLVSPARFIPLAEQSGLIQPIGEWVLTEACRFIRMLSAVENSPLHVAVNVSPRQLEFANFVQIVRRCIIGSGIKPSQLELEITESVLINSLDDSIRKLNELDELGVRLSLDDFGSGFSSLTYLRRLPVKTLKIDKSFIETLFDDKTQEGFIESIITMAHVLGLIVIAEGVETESQQVKLAELNCDCIQGYFFSRPVAEEEALRFLNNRNHPEEPG